MLTPAQAEEQIARHLPCLPIESLPVSQCAGAILRENVYAERDQPPFDRVSMDGIAVASASVAITQTLRVQGTQAAGDPPLALASPLHCIEIMTGAMLPAGCDAVVPVERISVSNGEVRIEVTHRGAGSCTVPGDPARLERVLENLLDNAVSFSPPPTGVEPSTIEVDILCESHGDRGGHVAIAVSDHGPGIAADARDKVFERFHSLRPAGVDFGSHSGLGLAIARTIVEAHYGTLTAGDRTDGQPGARLAIDLPAWESA